MPSKIERDPLRDPLPGDEFIDRYGQPHVYREDWRFIPGMSFDLKGWRRSMRAGRCVKRAKARNFDCCKKAGKK